MFLLFFINSGCDLSNPSAQNEVFNRFEEKFVDHFPPGHTDIYHQVDFFPGKNIPHSGAYSRWTITLDKQEIRSLVTRYSLESMGSYSHSEYDCFVCDYAEINPLYRVDCSINDYPIPNFHWIRKKLKLKGNFLSSDFLIYVLEAKQGNFLDNEMLIESPCSEWRHGYSKGIIISEERGLVIFWVEIW